MVDLEVHALLYRALSSPLGVAAKCNNFQLAQQRLYAIRREIGDAELASLQFRRSPWGDHEIWLTKTTGRKTASQTTEAPIAPLK